MENLIVDMGISQLKKYLPNRYPYLLIDKATEVIPGVSAKGYKNITANEWFFSAHFPGNPIMPGAIQIEALLQMLSLTVLTMKENEGLVVHGMSADMIRLKRQIIPGYCMEIEAELVSWDAMEKIAFGKVQSYIEGDEACSGEFKIKLVKPIAEETE